MLNTTTRGLATVLVASLLTAGAVTAATAGATPAANTVAVEPGSQTAAGIGWRAERTGDAVTVTTDAGSLAAHDGQFQVLDPSGTVVAALPLAYDLGGLRYPVAARIDGNTATLTPTTDIAQATPVAMAEPIDAPDLDAALGTAGTNFGLATGVGALLGSVVGLVGGCVLGAIVPAALMTPIFFPGWIGGCLAGASAGVGIGAGVGTIVVGAPVGIAAAIQFFQTMNAPGADAAADPAPAA